MTIVSLFGSQNITEFRNRVWRRRSGNSTAFWISISLFLFVNSFPRYDRRRTSDEDDQSRDYYRYTVFWHLFSSFFFSSRDYLLAMSYFRNMPFLIKDLICWTFQNLPQGRAEEEKELRKPGDFWLCSYGQGSRTSQFSLHNIKRTGFFPLIRHTLYINLNKNKIN